MCMMDGCAYVNDRYVCTSLCVPVCVKCAYICICVHTYSTCAYRYIIFYAHVFDT